MVHSKEKKLYSVPVSSNLRSCFNSFDSASDSPSFFSSYLDIFKVECGEICSDNVCFSICDIRSKAICIPRLAKDNSFAIYSLPSESND